MYYNARWYDPMLGRFAQADPIVPGPGNPLAFDRYAYVFNNPLIYVDPFGYLPCLDNGYCPESDDTELDYELWTYGIELEGEWTEEEKEDVLEASELTADKWAEEGEDPKEVFKDLYGPILITIDPNADIMEGANCKVWGKYITCLTAPTTPTIVHELGHVLDKKNNMDLSEQIPRGERTTEGLQCHPETTCLANTFNLNMIPEDYLAYANLMAEEFADMHMNWILDDVPGYEDYGLTEDITPENYEIYDLETWWELFIIPLVR
jgi:hypothetical protein